MNYKLVMLKDVAVGTFVVCAVKEVKSALSDTEIPLEVQFGIRIEREKISDRGKGRLIGIGQAQRFSGGEQLISACSYVPEDALVFATTEPEEAVAVFYAFCEEKF